LQGAGEIVAAVCDKATRSRQMTLDRNLKKFNDWDIVAHYAKKRNKITKTTTYRKVRHKAHQLNRIAI